MLKKGDIIKHSRSMDVCFEIIKNTDNKFFVGHWINMGFVSSSYIDHNISITIEDLSSWMKCLEPEIKCLRYAIFKTL